MTSQRWSMGHAVVSAWWAFAPCKYNYGIKSIIKCHFKHSHLNETPANR